MFTEAHALYPPQRRANLLLLTPLSIIITMAPKALILIAEGTEEMEVGYSSLVLQPCCSH